ncbi:Annexin (Annexin) Family [Phytophthora cinnamomi]|uniref:Annexin (Annexin) Family n=1 Tax=Phytophthora cinnamomi TaxID=4785 RepID=UPI003559B72D|nr:Annexin (Annexin) Family [Phytophthora cinnamomi]
MLALVGVVAGAIDTAGVIGTTVSAIRSETTTTADANLTETTETGSSGDVTSSVTERGDYTVTSGWTSGMGVNHQTLQVPEITETTVMSSDVSRDSSKVTGVVMGAVGAAVVIGSAVSATRSKTTFGDVSSIETTEVTETTETVTTKPLGKCVAYAYPGRSGEYCQLLSLRVVLLRIAIGASVSVEEKASISSSSAVAVGASTTESAPCSVSAGITASMSGVSIEESRVAVTEAETGTTVMRSLYTRYTRESSGVEAMSSSADINAAAQEIQRVCTGAASDEAALASLQLSKTAEQRHLIWWRYRILFKQSLRVWVKSMSDYSILLKMLTSTLERVEAEILRKSTKVLGTTEELILPGDDGLLERQDRAAEDDGSEEVQWQPGGDLVEGGQELGHLRRECELKHELLDEVLLLVDEHRHAQEKAKEETRAKSLAAEKAGEVVRELAVQRLNRRDPPGKDESTRTGHSPNKFAKLAEVLREHKEKELELRHEQWEQERNDRLAAKARRREDQQHLLQVLTLLIKK